MAFDKDDYWQNRLNEDIKGNPKPLRGQGEKIKDKRVLWFGNHTPIKLGINKFKRDNTKGFLGGPANPKHRSIRGKVLRDLKAESWIDFLHRNQPDPKQRIKARLGK